MAKASTPKRPWKWTLELPEYWPKGTNVLYHQHWRERYRETERCAAYVTGYGSPLPCFASPVKLTITRVWGFRQRALDPDNLAASVKVLIDVLRSPKGKETKNRLGVIVDDRPENFVGGGPIILQEKATGLGKLPRSQRMTGRGSRAIIVIVGDKAQESKP